jgi:hypothetical protein
MTEPTNTVNGVNISFKVYDGYDDAMSDILNSSISRFVTRVYGQDVEEEGEQELEDFYDLIKEGSESDPPEIGEKIIEMIKEQIAKHPTFDSIFFYAVHESWQRHHPPYMISFWAGCPKKMNL